MSNPIVLALSAKAMQASLLLSLNREEVMTTKQKILIVDDDENIAELLSLYLTKECFDTQMVYDGEEALRAFDSYQPNLILLDLMLPGIDGYQSAGKSVPDPTYRSSCSPLRERSLTRCLPGTWCGRLYYQTV